MVRKFLVFLCVLLLIPALVACGRSETSPAPPAGSGGTAGDRAGTGPGGQGTPEQVAGKLVVYSSASEELLSQLTPLIRARYPNLEVEWVYGGTEQLIDRLTEEFAAGNVQADAIMLGDPSYVRLLKQEGRLLPYKPAGWDQVQVDKDPEGHFFSVRVLNIVLIYNPELVPASQAPRSFQDLISPVWAGQVTMSDPLKSGTSFATVGALVQKFGWDYFKAAQANGWQVGGGSSAPVDKVASGEAKVGIAVEYKALEAKAAGKKVELVWPADGTIVLESPFAILSTARNPAGARAVADILLTPEAQALFTQEGMHAVIPGIAPPAGSRPLHQLLPAAMKVDWDRLAAEKAQIQDTFAQTVTINK